jgi:hypothetical protein
LIKQPDEFLDLDQLNLMNAIVARSVDLFDDQSRDLAHIVNRTAVGGPPSGGGDTDTGPPTSSATDTADPAAASTGFTSSDSTDGASNPTVDDGTAASSNQTTNGCACNVREDASSRGALIFALMFVPAIRRLRPVARS